MIMNLDISNKNLMELTQEQVLEMIMSEGCTNALEFWDKPKILRFNNTTF